MTVQVLENADLFTSRGVLKLMGTAPFSAFPWNIVAFKYHGVIFLFDHKREVQTDFKSRQGDYMGHKFEQYVTSDSLTVYFLLKLTKVKFTKTKTNVMRRAFAWTNKYGRLGPTGYFEAHQYLQEAHGNAAVVFRMRGQATQLLVLLGNGRCRHG